MDVNPYIVGDSRGEPRYDGESNPAREKFGENPSFGAVVGLCGVMGEAGDSGKGAFKNGDPRAYWGD